MEKFEEIGGDLQTLADFVRWGASAFNRANCILATVLRMPWMKR